VPEVAVNENGCLFSRQGDVRGAGGFFIVLLEVNPLFPQIFKDNLLNLRFFAPDFRHYLASFFFGE